MRGKVVAAVARYAVPSASTTGTLFQDQYISQLVSSMAKAGIAVRFVEIDGRAVAVSSNAPAVAGWFDGGDALLLYRTGSEPSLNDLVASVMASDGAAASAPRKSERAGD